MDEEGRIYCRRGYEAALARLASYEATGLSPDEVTKMGMMFEDSKRYSGRIELKLKAVERRSPQWIPVTERLPETGVPVLIHNRNWDYCVVANYAGCGDVWMDTWRQRLSYSHTHWMPLPELPKGVDK